MRITTWAAVAVTLLMGLANLGLVTDGQAGLRILGLVLAIAAAVAVYGLIAPRSWGAKAVISVGAVNLVVAIAGGIAGFDGWPVGLVLSALAIVLVMASKPASRPVSAP